MKLNWFSPLPPARTDIANYATRLLPALARRAELVLWSDQDGDVPPPPGVPAEVRRYRPGEVPWAELNRADMTVYHLGNNNEHHGAIWQVSRRHPGAVVLHDCRLPHFFLGLHKNRLRDRGAYLALMDRFYGAKGRLLASEFWELRVSPEHMTEHYPLTPFAVEGALGVLVHTPDSYAALQPWRRWPLAYQPLAYRAAARRPPRAAPPAPGAPHRLIVFGYISANRRLESVLEALAVFPARGRFRLDVFGELWDGEGVARRVRDAGLGELVTLHGFVTDEELEAALAASHLAINLRYPTTGEASGSQLKIWEHSLPSLVSRTGWYGTLPASAVAQVRPGHEVEDIGRHLSAYLAAPGRFARMGEEGRQLLLTHHTPEAYAEGLLALCEAARGHRPRALSYYLAERAGAELGALGGGPAARPVAAEIARLVA